MSAVFFATYFGFSVVLALVLARLITRGLYWLEDRFYDWSARAGEEQERRS